MVGFFLGFFFFSSRRRHTILQGDWSSDVCSSDLAFDLTGTWLGPASDDSGPTTMTWQLTQSGGSIIGSFLGVEPAPHRTQYQGTISGSLSGTSLTYTIDVP